MPMTTPASLDKIVLQAPRHDFRLHDIHSGLWNPTQGVHVPIGPDAKQLVPWTMDAKGNPVYGSLKAQVPIGDHGAIIHLAVNGTGLKVTANPNKWEHPWEGTATAAKLPEIRSTLAKVVGRFASVNVDRMATIHVDVERSSAMSDKPVKYADAMRICPPPRKVAFPEPNGIRYGTAKQAVQTAFYDIVERVAEVNKIRTGVPVNLARLETRMNNDKSISKRLAVGTLADLARLTDADLMAGYIETMNAEVFRLMPATAHAAGGQLFIPYSQGVYELDAYTEAFGGKVGVASNHYEKALGVDGILLRFGSFTAYGQHLRSRGMDRIQAWRKIKNMEQDYKLMPAIKNKSSMVQYLHELHERFTIAA